MTDKESVLWQHLFNTAAARAAEELGEPRLLAWVRWYKPDRRFKRPHWAVHTVWRDDLAAEQWPAYVYPHEGVEFYGGDRSFKVRAGVERLTLHLRENTPAVVARPYNPEAYPADLGAELAAVFAGLKKELCRAQALAVELYYFLSARAGLIRPAEET